LKLINIFQRIKKPQPLLGMFRAIAPENLTLYLFTLSHSSITGD